PVSSLYADAVPVTLVIEDVNDLDEIDTPLLTHVIDNLNAYLGAGLRFACAELLAGDQPSELPLAGPQLFFYAGPEWLMHFRHSRIPGSKPYGVMVVFDQHQAVRIEEV